MKVLFCAVGDLCLCLLYLLKAEAFSESRRPSGGDELGLNATSQFAVLHQIIKPILRASAQYPTVATLSSVVAVICSVACLLCRKRQNQISEKKEVSRPPVHQEETYGTEIDSPPSKEADGNNNNCSRTSCSGAESIAKMMEVLSPSAGTPTRANSAYCIPKKFSLTIHPEHFATKSSNPPGSLLLGNRLPSPAAVTKGVQLESIHHRRSRSLRERTGVGSASRLEQLGFSVDAMKSVHISPPMIWTVASGTNTERSRPVRKSDFLEHVKLMDGDKEFRFIQEFEDLKLAGKQQSYISGDLPHNRSKNRFTNILPFDSTRVKLQQIDGMIGSDYINANFVNGFSGDKEYVATQGPLSGTRNDFWRMVWEQNCPSIVNLTRCVEKGKEKCLRYWPTEPFRPLSCANVQVTLLKETIHSEFTVREFYVVNKLEPCSPPRSINQYHYTAWPDFGVPEKPDSLLGFVHAFRSDHRLSGKGPIVVHCSAGVGRSGTFIGIDRLLQSLDNREFIDIFGTVYEMRCQRMQMVQAEQQYATIHHCIASVLENKFASSVVDVDMETDCITIELPVPQSFANGVI